jgi:hypothetical protein
LRNLLGINQEEEEPLQAEVVVEYTKSDVERIRGNQPGQILQFPRIYHKFGSTMVMAGLPDIRAEFVEESVDGRPVRVPPVAERYKLLRKDKLKDSKEGKTPEALLEVAEWALNHLRLKEFSDVMEELREVAPSHESVKAYDTVKKAMAARITKDDPAIEWRADRLPTNYKTKRGEHHTVLYNSPETDPKEVLDYLALLEKNYEGFFYWFALKGKALPVPDKRLVAMLVDKKEEFLGYRRVFDNTPLVADGFYNRAENLAVFSMARVDQVFDLLNKTTNPLWQSGWNIDDLLNAKGHPGAQPQEVVRNQMLALLLKGMQDESAWASVSHVASRQLAVATGLISTNVAVPESLQFGIGSFFETPLGAFWPGIGAPSWTYMVKFKLWKKNNVLDRPEDAIRSVITDQYFREITDDSKRTVALTKARTMAWSFTFFLMNRHLNHLLRYCEELKNLPRDMEFDDDTLLAAFGRAFEMTDPNDPYHVHTAKLDRLAQEWYSYIELTPIESSAAMEEAIKEYEKQQKKNKTGPNQPKQTKPNYPRIQWPIRRR